jgi:hypothetical protein
VGKRLFLLLVQVREWLIEKGARIQRVRLCSKPERFAPEKMAFAPSVLAE